MKNRKKIILIVVLVFVIFLAYQCGSASGDVTQKSSELGMTAKDYRASEYATEQLSYDSSSRSAPDVSDPNATFGMTNALRKAKSYLEYSAFSYTGLIDQLEYSGFTHDESVYAADHCGADWDQQAVSKAESYLEYSAFSHDGLIDQLEYNGFTHEQAVSAADNCGADWNEQAVLKAQSYLEYSAFSRDRLIDQLEYNGFTHDQAVYAVGKVGY